MKKLMILGASALCVLAACGVDKEGTADKLVKDLEARDGITLDSDQKDCVKQVITSMSDDEITAISEGKADADAMATFGLSVGTCISGETVTDEATESEDVPAEDVTEEASEEG